MKTTNDKSLETILVWVLFLVLLYWIFKDSGFLMAAAIIGLAGLLAPALAAKLHWAWMWLTRAIGTLTSTILLTIIFFLILTPLALISRLIGKNSLQLKPGAPTYFKTRHKTYDRDSLENSW